MRERSWIKGLQEDEKEWRVKVQRLQRQGLIVMATIIYLSDYRQSQSMMWRFFVFLSGFEGHPLKSFSHDFGFYEADVRLVLYGN